MKNLILPLIMITSLQQMPGMEMAPLPPKASSLTIFKSLEEKPHIQHRIFSLLNDGNIYDASKTMLALAGTNKQNRRFINENMITILECRSHTASALDMHQLLLNKTCSLPVMKTPQMRAWSLNAKNNLCEGKALFNAMDIGGTVARVKELLDIKNIALNQEIDGLYGPESRNTRILSYAVGYGYHSGMREKIELLLDAGANPNGADNNGWPLLTAVEVGDGELVRLLLKAGANPLTKTKGGTTALEWARFLMERSGERGSKNWYEIELPKIVELLTQAESHKKQESAERRQKLGLSDRSCVIC